MPLERRILFPGILLWTLTQPVSAAPKTWTLDSIMNLKSVSDPQLDRPGRQCAFVVTSVDSSRNAYSSRIFVTHLDSGPAHPLPSSQGFETHPRWSPDGHWLAFLSSKGGVTQIYVSSIVDQAARSVTASKTGILDFKWSADGKSIAYLAIDPDPVREQRARMGDDPIVGGEGYKPARVHTIGLDGANDRVATPEKRHIVSFDWSSGAGRLVYASQKSPAGRDAFQVDLYEIEMSSGVEKALVEQPGQDSFPCYSPDGRWIAFYSQGGVLSYFGERKIGMVASGGGPVRYVSERLDGDVFSTSRMWWSEDGSKLLFGAGRGTNEFLFAVNPQNGDSQRLPYVLTSTSAFSVSADGNRIAWIKSTPEAPGEVWVRDVPAGRDTQVSDANPKVRDYPAVHARSVKWKSPDGLDVEGVLRLPFDFAPGKRVPLLTVLHGGPTGAALESFPIPRTYPTQLYLQAGFAVFEPNFRGSINYGAKFRLPTIEQQGIGDMNDIMSGIDSLIAQGIADPDRLGVMGWSYGGYLSVWTVGHSQRFKAASIGACTTDWVSWYAPSIANKEAAPEVMWEYFGGKPWNRLDVYDQRSPRASLKNIRTPSIVLHGEKDIDSGPEVYVALRDLGVPVEYVTYPREGHGIMEPMHQRDLLTRNLEWFKRWISPR